MKAYLPDHTVAQPATLEEALSLMAACEYRPLAGGTDLMVGLEMGAIPPGAYLDLSRIQSLKTGPDLSESGLRLSPLTTYACVRSRPDITTRFPLLKIAAREVGVLAIQSRGTWVGNVANASPAADGVPALMAYDAQVELTSQQGSRRVPLCDFYHGYKTMDRKPNELITALHLPSPVSGRFEYYRKVGTRRFQAISKVVLAGWITLDQGTITDARLVLGSVAPHTLRARRTELALKGQSLGAKTISAARLALMGEISPIDDVRSTAEYRRKVAGNLLADFLNKLKVSVAE